MVRLALDVLSTPNAEGELIAEAGFANCGVFVTSNASAWTARLTDSHIGKVLFKLASRLKSPGPRTLLRLEVPKRGDDAVDAVTSEKAAAFR